jgi:hypothetical protein
MNSSFRSTGSGIVDTDAHAMGSKLDTVVRIFDSAGKQVASNDDYAMGPDSFLSYVAPADGRYFIGISSFGNTNYSPTASGREARQKRRFQSFARQ